MGEVKPLLLSTPGESGSEKESIWQQVLAQASKKSQPLPAKTLVILGERNAGKSSLVARLQGQDLIEGAKGGGGGIALDYAYLDILLSEENDDLLDRLNIWTLEGELAFADLLDLAINDSTAAKSLALIALDLSQPWVLAETLHKWIKVLENHIEARSLKEDKAEGLGIPLLVVVNKSDTRAALEKDYGYKDDHFTFIQQHLRKICLEYKAGLLYVSAKRDKNCDILRGYVKHLLYGLNFEGSAQVIEKDTLFVPAGWDSLEKIKIDFDNQSVAKDQDYPFQEAIKVPSSVSRQTKTTYEAEVLAEDDQAFLERQFKQVEKAPSQLGSAQSASGSSSSHFTSPAKSSPGTPAEETLPSTPIRTTSRSSLGAATPATPLPSPAKGASAAPADGTPSRGKGGQNEHKVLSEFFHSLINKDPRASTTRRKTPSSGSANTPSRKDAEKSISRLTAKRDQ
jgi:dynein light intermediate chain 1